MYIVHATSALYIEQCTLPPAKRHSNQMERPFTTHSPTVKMAVRTWMNPRRLRLRLDLDRSSTSARMAPTRAFFIQYFEEKQPAVMYNRLKFCSQTCCVASCLGRFLLWHWSRHSALLPGSRDFRPMHQSYFSWSTVAVKPLIYIPSRQTITL